MILVYMGKGKGKTSACVGQAVRALGQNMTVAFAQFMKRDGQAGEQAMLARLLGEGFYAGGEGFFRIEQGAAHRRAAHVTLAWAMARLPEADMLVLDESLYALGAGLLERAEVETLLTAAQAKGTHVVLSGRALPDWLATTADIVTEMGDVKHPWKQGVPATKGIEF